MYPLKIISILNSCALFSICYAATANFQSRLFGKPNSC